MKLRFSKEKFLDGLQQVQNVVSTRSTLPILSNVLIRAGKPGISLTTTDLDIGIRCSIEATVIREGSITLPAKRLFTIIRELAHSEVELEVDEKNMAIIESGGSHFKIVGIPEAEFPQLPKLEGSKSFTIDQKLLRDALKKTSYAMSTDETRYVLNGILLSLKEDKLVIVATDGRRLALVENDVDLPKGTKGELLIPSKTVNEVLHLLKDKGTVAVAFSENQVSFEMDGTLIVSKLVEGVYPNYRQVIPSETKERISLERETFHQAVRRAALLTSEKNNTVKLAFSKNNLAISAHSPEVGESRESLAINYKGQNITIGFNPDFLMDPLRNLENDEIFFELTDELSPGVIRINAPFLYVIMPMRVS
jgi:DNA polymerase III subunit beta